MILQMLLLLERLDAARMWAFELALVTFHVPVKFAFRDELTVEANWALEF